MTQRRTFWPAWIEEPTLGGGPGAGAGARDCLTDAEFDAACPALADFADIKSPYTLGHSPAWRR